MKARVRLNAMEFHAYHGVYPKEQTEGGRFRVALQFDYDAKSAMESDRLEDALDYSVAYRIVESCMAQRSDLLEHVAGRILKTVKTQFPEVTGLQVRIDKLRPPMDGELESVSVEMQAEEA